MEIRFVFQRIRSWGKMHTRQGVLYQTEDGFVSGNPEVVTKLLRFTVQHCALLAQIRATFNGLLSVSYVTTVQRYSEFPLSGYW